MKKKLAERAQAMSRATQARESKEIEECTASAQSESSVESDKTGKKDSVTFLTEVTEESDDKAKQPDTLQNLQKHLAELKAAAKAEEEVKQHPTGKRRGSGSRKDWDSYLMSQLSQLTATWIVHERMSPSQERQDLVKTLQGWYGKPKYTDLVQEKGSDSEDELDPRKKDKKVKPKKKWKKAEET
nr:hypothetical protein BaRGS_017568 [Batillaria attramentaria]